MKLIRALPDRSTLRYNTFTEQETIGITDDLEGVPLAIAQSHCMLSQTRCSVVRERARGPKGGRGAFQYNSGTDGTWPAAWRPNKHYHYYIILAVMPKGTSTKVHTTQVGAYNQLLGVDYGKAGEWKAFADEVSPINVEAWKKLPYNKR